MNNGDNISVIPGSKLVKFWRNCIGDGESHCVTDRQTELQKEGFKVRVILDYIKHPVRTAQ